MVSKMVYPPWPPIAESEGMTVSRHAEFIFKHIEHWLEPYMPYMELAFT